MEVVERLIAPVVTTTSIIRSTNKASKPRFTRKKMAFKMEREDMGQITNRRWITVLLLLLLKIVHDVQKDRIRQKKRQNNQHVHK